MERVLPRERLLAGLMLAGVVAGLHVLLWSRIGGLAWAPQPGGDGSPRPARPAASRVWMVRHPAAVGPVGRTAGSDAPDRAARTPAVPAEAPRRPLGVPELAFARSHPVRSAMPEAVSRAAADADVAPGRPGVPPPQYLARLPSSAQLTLSAWRGTHRLGDASLTWWHDDARYQLQLSWPVAPPPAATLIEQTSSGRVGPHGLLPERFVDRRARRGARAVSVQCDDAAGGGAVSFSAVTTRAPCVVGLQDGLSWWLQLWAIVAAQPAPPAPGAAFSLAVARLHGEVEVWTFVVEPDADAAVLKLVRHPGRAPQLADLTAELWLDAAPPHAWRRVRVQPTRGEPLVWERLESTSRDDS